MTPPNLMHDLLPEAVRQALGWTLLHSLWQGTLLALVLAALLGLMHRHAAAVRYQVAVAGLVVLLFVSTLTFYKLYDPSAIITGGNAGAAAGNIWQVDSAHNLSPTLSGWEKAREQGQTYFNQHLPAVVMLWLLGMLVMGLRLLGGWVYVQRLRSYRTQAVPEAWQKKTRELSQKLGLTQLVGLVESGLVQVPLVIGHFKPLILLPLGALAGLPVAQTEAILAHELAHVSRRDYLINLLQCVVETLFFFHPAVWWLSDCVRTEREHACDDLALTVCGNSLTYVYALTNLEKLTMKNNPTTPPLAMAFSGRRRSLLSRITRLVQKSTHRPSFSEGFLASFAVMAGLLVFAASAWANNPTAGKPLPKATTQQKISITALNPAPAKPLIVPDEPENEYTLKQLDDDLVIVQDKKGKVVEVYVNGRRVPKSQLSQYQERINNQLAAAKNAKTVRDPAEAEAMRQQLEVSVSRLERENDRSLPRVPPAPRAPEATRANPAPRAPAARPYRGVLPVPPVPPVAPVAPLPGDEGANKRYNSALKEYEAQIKSYETRMKEYTARQEEFNTRIEVNREALTAAHERRMADHDLRIKDHEKRMTEHNLRMEEHQERMKKHDAMMKSLNAALLADGFIKQAGADYDFKLDKTGLYIQEQKQPEAMFQKYRKLIQDATGEDLDLMLKKEGTNIRINSNHSTTTTK